MVIFLQIIPLKSFLDLKPRLAKRLNPCLPAYLLFLGFRFYDKTCDDAGLTGLFNAVHTVLRDNSMVIFFYKYNSMALSNGQSLKVGVFLLIFIRSLSGTLTIF